MSGVRCAPENIFQLSTFGLWKHTDSKIHTYGRSFMTRAYPPCSPTVTVTTAWDHTIVYPMWLWE